MYLLDFPESALEAHTKVWPHCVIVLAINQRNISRIVYPLYSMCVQKTASALFHMPAIHVS